jgi:hypothetical protein
MKRWISPSIFGLLACLAVLAPAQWQAQPQIDTRNGPIYPTNPSYNFHSRSNYNPFQFNWGTGRWDYVSIPDDSSQSSHEYAPLPGAVPYLPYGGDQPKQSDNNPAHTVNPNQDNNPPAPTPNDSDLWSAPTTRPEPTVVPQIVKFEGRIVGIKAVDLDGEPTPHLLLRLRSDTGATGTIDAGQRLPFPDAAFDPSTKGHVSVTGQLGVLDGHILLFADQIAFGPQTITIDRPGKTPAK